MNILLTSVGRRGYLVDYFMDANINGKVFVSNSNYTFPLKKADGYFLTPLIYDEDYIPKILDYCLKNNIKAIISLFDVDLLVLAKNESVFLENGIKLLLAPYSSVEICNDKWETYKFFLQNGLKTPKSFINLNNAIEALNNGKLKFPLILKPRWGMASLNIYQADDATELEIFFNKINKDVFKSHLKYESSLTIDANVIIQETIIGQEYGIDIFNDLNANYIECFAKKKVSMRAGETDIGETVSNKSFKAISQKLSNLLKHRGILSLDCFENESGIFLLEMNCRISGHYPISHCAGVNVPKQIIEWLNLKETNPNNLNFKEGIFVCKELKPIIF